MGLALLLVLSLPMMARADNDIAALQAKANAGDAEAQFELGVDYRWGLGVKRDEAEAMRWYRKAADQGLAKAQYNLAIAYDGGIGVKEDTTEAVRWYRKAAEQGHLKAQFDLGMKQNGAETVRWLSKAAEQGLIRAQTNLGHAYLHGSSGVERDAAEAMRWFRKAADQGDTDAQYNLSLAYAQGNGVEKDAAEAAHWEQKQKASESREVADNALRMHDLAKDDPDRKQILDAARKPASEEWHGQIKFAVHDLIKDGDTAYLCALIQVDGDLARNDAGFLNVGMWGLRKLADGWHAVLVHWDLAWESPQVDCRIWDHEITSRDDIINAISEAR